MGDFFGQLRATVGSLGQGLGRHAGPVAAGAWKAVDGVGQDLSKHLGPAGEDAWRAVDGLAQEAGKHVGPAIGDASRAIEKFGEGLGNNIGPVANEAWKAAEGLGQEVGQYIGHNFSTEAITWIEAHPYKTAFYVLNGVLLVAPGLATGPLLGALGWTSTGPRAATVAAALQPADVTARSVFAVLQSAGMGGYGVPVVAGVTRALVAVASLTGTLLSGSPLEPGEATQPADGARDEGEGNLQPDVTGEASEHD